MRYLKNIGKPTIVTISTQKCISWIESDGIRKVLEVIWSGRECYSQSADNLSVGDVRELKLAKQLGLGSSEKAYIYYDKNATITPGKPMEVSSGRPIGKPIKQYVDHTFTVSNYPHIINCEIGIAGKNYGSQFYNLPVAGSDWAKKLDSDVVEIENDLHAEEIIKRFHFVDECDKDGKIIQENPYRLKEDNKKVVGDFPKVFIEVDDKAVPRTSKRNMEAKLNRDDEAEI